MPRVATVRGFILQASYRVVAAGNGKRGPVVYLYGQLERGGTFLVRDDRQRPDFYVRAADAERCRALRTPPPRPLDKRTFDGAPVCRIEVDIPPMYRRFVTACTRPASTRSKPTCASLRTT